MISSYLEYINEDNQSGSSVSLKHATDVIKLIQNNSDPSDEYIEIRELEYREPDTYDLVIELKVSESPDFSTDSHFNNLQWEELNYSKYGFAIDANAHFSKTDLLVPEIIITLIIDPSRIPDLYKELKYRLVDIITHETKHTHQVGWNRKPFNSRPSSYQDRTGSKKSYSYFLLPDEIEAYVYGMYTRSKSENLPIDVIFNKYLEPFIKTKEISKSEYDIVIKAWVTHTLEKYPDAKFSPGNQKIEKIINSI